MGTTRVERQKYYAAIGQFVYQRYRKSAHHAVSLAVASGRLAHPTLKRCVDCGGNAAVYDHRDYSEPMKVEAVCDSCNHKRGIGAFAFERIRLDLQPFWGSRGDADEYTAIVSREF